MYKRILAPLDGSELSECTLEHIKSIAAGCKTPEVVLLTVVGGSQPTFEYYASEQMVKEAIEQREKEANEIKRKAEDYLGKVADGLRKDSIPVQTEVIQISFVSRVADAILDYAQDNKVDLIVMSTHGRSGISRWAFGSVADKVVSNAKVPVLTITAAGCRV